MKRHLNLTVLTALMVVGFLLGGSGLASAWTLIWNPSTGSPQGYIVDISTDAGVTWPYRYVVSTEDLMLDDKCQFGKTYQFRVSAYNVAGVSEPSESLAWTRPGYVPPIEAPLPAVNDGTRPDLVGGLNVQ